MEQTAKSEENHHTIVRIPLPKSSLTRINGIHIDLTNSIDDQQDKRKCEHFTIRGYVTEERKKDVSVCVPLFINKKQNEAEERNSTILPPMEVAKFKDWRCHNCLRELGSACSLKEIRKLSDSLPSKNVFKSLCSTKANLNNAPSILESAPAGGSENDVNHQILPAAKDIITIQPPLVLEKYADDSDVIGKKISGNLDICDPSFKNHLSTKFENAIARIGKATVQHRRESDVTGNLNSKPRNNDQSKGDDGIPMEIDELVAKHQYKRRREEYERRRAEYERNLCLQGRNNGKTKLESMGVTKILGNGLLKSYPVEQQNMRKQIFQTKDVKLSDQLAPISINEPQADMSKLGGKKSAFVKWNSLSNNQGTREARYSVFANNANFPQASKFAHNSQVSEGASYWKMAKGLDLNFPNQSYRNFEKQNRVFGVESLGKSSDLKFGNENYRNFAKKSTDSSVRSHGNPSDLDTVIEKYSYFKKNKDVVVDSLRKSSGLNFADKPFSSSGYPPKVLDKPLFITDHSPKLLFGRDIGVSTSGSRLSSFQVLDKPIYISDGHSEEPSGRGFGLFSSKALSSKVLDKPMLISDDHSKEPFGRDIGVSTSGSRLSSFQVLGKPIYISDGHSEEPSGRGFGLFSSKASSSKVLDKPILISDDHSKEPFGRDIGVSTSGSRLSSFQVLDKPIYISDGHFEEPSGRGFGLFSSKALSSKVLDKPILISDDHSKEPFGRDIGVSTSGSRLSSFQVLDKPIYISDSHSEEPSGRGFGLFSSKASSSNVLNKPMLISDDHSKEPFGRYIGVSNNILRPSSFSSKSNPEEGNGVPTQVPSKSEEKNKGQAKNSAGKLQNFVSVPNGQNTSRNEFCDVNRNPADFSFAEPGNEFTISGSDLKLNQTMPLKRKQGTGNRDGKKKQKTVVPTVPKPQ